MKNIQHTTAGSLLVLALAASIASGVVLLTPSSAHAMCCTPECSSGCCSAQGECAKCSEFGCCTYDGDPCGEGQIVDCVWC